MKRIAIMTQPLGQNYGGIIQNYALQKVLRDQGVNPVTIAREKAYSRRLLSLLKNETYNRLFKKQRKIFSYAEIQFVTSELRRFIDQYIDISPKIFDTKSLKKYFELNDFDAVIVGSDQTWRPAYSPDIYNFFLDFLENTSNIKKLAYASSFGTDSWEFSKKETVRCRSLSQLFNAVSVREKSGVSLSLDHLGVKALWVLDPTLLLNRTDYYEIFKNIPKRSGGLFTYILDSDTNKSAMINNVSNILKIDVFKNQPVRSLNDVHNFTDCNDYVFPSLEKWLRSFYDAQFIITDSFHGTVFSIIFEKPFLTVVNKSRGASRFYSLLESLGLENRLVADPTNFNFDILSQEINYEKVNGALSHYRNSSMDFLRESLF